MITIKSYSLNKLVFNMLFANIATFFCQETRKFFTVPELIF